MANKALNIILISIILVFTLGSILYHLPFDPENDAGTFASIGLHLAKGKILYKEAWDHKQPVIFLINQLALSIFGINFFSIRLIEILFGLVSSSLMFVLLRKIFQNHLLPFFLSLIFIIVFYSHNIFNHGNSTEEFGVTFILAGVYFLLTNLIFSGKDYYLALAGIFFTLAVFTKEPFLFSAIPWILYLFIRIMLIEGKRLLKLLYFFAGVAGVCALILFYFIYHGSFSDYIDQISHSYNYSKLISTTASFREKFSESFSLFYNEIIQRNKLIKFLLIVSLLSQFFKNFQKKYYYLPLTFLVLFLMDMAATSLSGERYGHYYLQAVPSFIFLAAAGLFFLIYVLEFVITRYFEKIKIKYPDPKRTFMVSILIFLIFILLDLNFISKNTNLSFTFSDTPSFKVVEYMNKNSSEGSLWMDYPYRGMIYLQTNKTSPSKYITPYPSYFPIPSYKFSMEDKLQLLYNEISSNPPEFIISGEKWSDAAGKSNLNTWTEKNYRLVLTEKLENSNVMNLWERNF